MTQEVITKLSALGVDIDVTLERFVGNETLYLRCLKTFCSNTDYDEMLKSIESSDARPAFEAAHALKGVSANLGLNHLYEEVKVITEVFRAGSLDYDKNNLDKIKSEYNIAIDVINSL